MNLLLQLLTNGIVNGALFAVLACAFGMVYRTARVFHIAFAGLFLVGPYTSFTASRSFSLPLSIAILAGIAAGALAGWLIERVLYRPLLHRKATSSAVMVASLGAFVVLVNVAAILYGNEVKTIERELSQRVVVGTIGLTTVQLWQFVLGVLAVCGLGVAIRRIRAFKVLWAMGDEPDLVPALGLPVNRFRVLVFSLSGALGALAGCLIGYDVGINPHMGMSYLLIAAVAVLAGGIDSFKGWVLGGFALAILQSLTVWKFSAKWMDLTTFSVLIAVLIFRPQGMMGVKKRLEEG